MLLSSLELWDSHIHGWAAALGWPVEGGLRLALAALAGGLIGLEREVRGRQAGFRTNMLVCLGSALVMIVSTRFASHPWQSSGGFNITVDPARIAYGVMTGVGFLGAGAIIQHHSEVRGLTTAAGLWCVAAIGLATGFGLYLVSAIATLLVLFALWFLDYVEDILPRQKYRVVTVRTRYRPGCVSEAFSHLAIPHVRIIGATFERTEDLVFMDIHLQIVYVRLSDYVALEHRIESDETYQLLGAREP